MPDLLDELRRYGDALEGEVTPLVRLPGTYAGSGRTGVYSRPTRRHALLAASVLALIAILAAAMLWVSDGNTNGTSRTDVRTADRPPGTTEPAVVLQTVRDKSTGDTWTKLSGGSLSARDGYSMVVAGDQLLIWGGAIPETSESYDDGAQYSLTAKAWTALPSAPLSPRAGHVAVWTGSEMVIWGGAASEDSGTSKLDGAAYSPTSRSWRRIAEAPLPVGPQYAGVWTGAEMMVVGATQSEAHGAAYDPETNKWHTLSSVTMRTTLQARVELIWTGTRLVAFDPVPQLAGLAGGVQFFTYDPASDAWAETRITDFKEQFFGAGALDGLVYLVGYGDTMVRFDPVRRTWETRESVVPSCEDIPEVRPDGSEILISVCGSAVFYDPSSRQVRTLAPPPEGVRHWRPAAWVDGMLVTWQPAELPGGNLGTEVNEEPAVWMFAPARP
jgi:N-acetylneuraminic acid mutarotase